MVPQHFWPLGLFGPLELSIILNIQPSEVIQVLIYNLSHFEKIRFSTRYSFENGAVNRSKMVRLG